MKAGAAQVYLARYMDYVPYTEYAAPKDSLRSSPHPHECYIEAVTDERFTIVVKLLRGFDFMGCPSVDVEHRVEKSGPSFHYTLFRRKPGSRLRKTAIRIPFERAPPITRNRREDPQIERR